MAVKAITRAAKRTSAAYVAIGSLHLQEMQQQWFLNGTLSSPLPMIVSAKPDEEPTPENIYHVPFPPKRLEMLTVAKDSPLTDGGTKQHFVSRLPFLAISSQERISKPYNQWLFFGIW